jgi:hypothetical protein
MRRTFKAAMRSGEGVEVRGTVVMRLGVEFVVHHPPGRKGWMVSEPITGLRAIRFPMTTQKRAIQELEEVLSVPGRLEEVERKIAAVGRS